MSSQFALSADFVKKNMIVVVFSGVVLLKQRSSIVTALSKETDFFDFFFKFIVFMPFCFNR